MVNENFSNNIIFLYYLHQQLNDKALILILFRNYENLQSLHICVVKLFVVDKCIQITNTFHAENIKRRNRENSIENGESAYSYFLITFNLSFVTQIRSAEKKEKSYHAARHEAREKEDDQTRMMIQQLFLYY